VSKSVTIAGTTLTPSGQGASPMVLNLYATLNASASTPIYSNGANDANGLLAGLPSNTSNGVAVQSAMMSLPVSSTNIYYLDEVNGNGFFVEGLCVKQ